MNISIQEADFDLAVELDALRRQSPETGALVSFTGLVRDISDSEKIESLYLEHYPGMCEKALEKIVSEARQRWSLLGVRVVHRIGKLKPNEQIVLVATSSQHRADAFAACEFIIDYLKTAAPFWKREQTAHGAHWLDTKTSDEQRMQRWFPQGENNNG
jgi:molybdopterin synthase catalytic subunit